MKPLSSPAKNATPAAISFGSTGLPMGISLAAAAQASGEYLLITRFVAVLPGAITLTCIPKGASSNAKDFENPMMPAFDAAYAVRSALPVKPMSDEVLIIAPLPFAFIVATTARQQRNVDVRFV